MAAPTPTTRQTPTGLKLEDGFRTLITFARYPAVNFWEKTVQPSSRDGGEPIDQSTMHNVRRRTKKPRKLTDTKGGNATVAYDPAVISTIEEMINVEDTITWTFSDGTTWAEYGWLRSFEPSECKEGEQPEAKIMIELSNTDANGTETGVAVSSVTGT